jgi:hypothetical protein
MSGVGSRVSLYNEYTGTRRPASSACGVSIMLSCTSERKPCWGPKTAATVTSGAAISASTTCVNAPSTDAGFETMPMRRPRSRDEASRCVEPSVTGTAGL